MRAEEARILLGFPPNYRPTPFQVKAAYRKKVWDSHPDLFPGHEKCNAESKFKLISEAYTCLQSWLSYDGGYEEEEFRESHMPDVLHGFALQSIPCIPCRQMDSRGEGAGAGFETIVVRTGVASVPGGRKNHALIGVPFIFIILGTVALGGLNATRAYRKQQETYPSHNPFLP